MMEHAFSGGFYLPRGYYDLWVAAGITGNSNGSDNKPHRNLIKANDNNHVE